MKFYFFCNYVIYVICVDANVVITSGMIREDPSIKVSLVQECISSLFNYKVSYRKAWIAKQKAMTLVYGDWDESYAQLPIWLKHMQ